MGKGDVLEKKMIPEEPIYTCKSKEIGKLPSACSSKKKDDAKKIIKAIFKDSDGKIIEIVTVEDKVILEIHSENMSGETVVIDNPFKSKNFKLNGKVISDDVVIKLKINNNIEKIEFDVFNEKDEAKTANPIKNEDKKVKEEKKLGHFYSKEGEYLNFEIGAEDVYVEGVKIKEDHASLQKLAAVAYGEASTDDVYEEIAGIAAVIVRQTSERKSSILSLLSANSTYAFAASDGSARVKAFNGKKPADRNSNLGMMLAVKAAINAISDGTDYSNGGYFWDGVDIKTNYENHPKIKAGFHFSSEDHNVFDLKDNEVEVTTWWYDKNLKPTKIRGKYKFTYESTAAEGKTIFSRYTSDFLKAKGNKKHK